MSFLSQRGKKQTTDRQGMPVTAILSTEAVYKAVDTVALPPTWEEGRIFAEEVDEGGNDNKRAWN